MLDINTNSSTSGIQNKLGPVVRRVISADTGLNFNLCFFSFHLIFYTSLVCALIGYKFACNTYIVRL